MISVTVIFLVVFILGVLEIRSRRKANLPVKSVGFLGVSLFIIYLFIVLVTTV